MDSIRSPLVQSTRFFPCFPVQRQFNISCSHTSPSLLAPLFLPSCLCLLFFPPSKIFLLIWFPLFYISVYTNPITFPWQEGEAEQHAAASCPAVRFYLWIFHGGWDREGFARREYNVFHHLQYWVTKPNSVRRYHTRNTHQEALAQTDCVRSIYFFYFLNSKDTWAEAGCTNNVCLFS